MRVADDSLPGASSLFWLGALLLIVAVTCGGGQGGRGDLLAQLLAIVLLARLWWLKFEHGSVIRQGPTWALWLVPVTLALPLLQMLPIPMFVWNSSVARQEISAQLAAVGMLPSAHLGLIPLAAERALWSLLPAVALFISTLALSRRQQYWLLAILLLLALGNVMLGLAQLAQGRDSLLRLYENTNPEDAVGFFANRNHFASLLVMTLPLTVAGSAWIANETARGAPISPLWVVVGVLITALLILGVALSRSRAGLLLGMVAVLLSVPSILALRKRRGVKRVLTAILALGVMLSVQFALFGVLQRLDVDNLDDGRWHYARVAVDAAHAHAPIGAGLGGFRQAFQPFEAKVGFGPTIINHAHDDYLELWLEGGWLAMPPIALLVIALIAIGARAWFGRHESSGDDRLIARTVWLSLLIAALHSAVDYPLRTSADSGVFALLLAVALSHAWPGVVDSQATGQSPGRSRVGWRRRSEPSALPRFPR